MAANIGGVSINLALESAAFRRDVGKAAAALEQSATKMRLAMRGVERAANQVEKQVGQMRAGFAALAGALAVRQFAQFTRSAIDSAGAIKDVADKIGVSTKQLQQLRFAAAQSGVGINALDMGMQRFSRRIAEAAQGQGNLIKTAKQYGVALRDSDERMRSNIDVLKDFADVIKGAESNQERLRIAFQLFDSEGAALVNTLRDGRVGLEEYMRQAEAFGAVMSDKVIAQAKIAGDSLAALEMVYQASFNTAIIESFASGLTLTKENLDAVKEAASTFGRVVGLAMRGVAEAAKFVGANFREIVAVLGAIVALKAAEVIFAMARAFTVLALAMRAAAAAGGIMAAVSAGAKKGLVGLAAAAAGFFAIMEALKAADPALKDAIAGMDMFGESAGKAGAAVMATTPEIAKSTKALQLEAIQNQQLASAMKRSSAQYLELKDAIEIETEAAKLGVDFTTKAGKAWKQAAEDAQKYRRELAETAKVQEEAATTAASAARAQAAAISDPQLRRKAELQIDRQEKINELVREYGTVAKGTGQQLLAMWDSQAVSEEQIRFWNDVRSQAEDVAKDIGDFLVDGFVNAEKGGKSAFENIWEGAKAGAKRFIAQLASLFLQQHLILPVVASVIGSAPGLFGVTGPQSGIGGIGGVGLGGLGGLAGAGGGGGGFDILGTASNVLSLGRSAGLVGGLTSGITTAIDAFGTAAFGLANPAAAAAAEAAAAGIPGIGAADVAGATGLLGSTSLSSLLGGVGAGFAAGNLLNTLLGGHQTGGMIGSGVGALGGAVIGSIIPGIGTILGGLIGGAAGGGIGGLFGPKPSVGPSGGFGQVRFNTWGGAYGAPGGLYTTAGAGDNGLDPNALGDVMGQIATSLNTFAKALGGTFGPTGAIGALEFQGGSYFANVMVGPETGTMHSGYYQGFGSAQEAVDALIVNWVKRVQLSGVAPEITTVLKNTQATTLEGIASDVDFARSLAGLGSTIAPLDQAIQVVNDKFAEMEDRAKSLGLSLDQVNEAKERELEAVMLQARAPYLSAAANIATYLEAQRVVTLSPAAQFQEAQKSFGSLLDQVRGGNVALTGNLLQTADQLLGMGRQQFASGVSFANLQSFVTSSLASVGELLTSEEFFDAQVEATRQQTQVLSDDLQDVKDSIEKLRTEFQMWRQAA